ncbi:kelch-like protein 5 [Gigantopelta aegis]|uniref:kelch-like protein 5 n=1 Tax=Gigantopelta aegis TaxID=1735272 RepID=UPI001B887BE0|nr:kelch-like protein 5 [Gigantopelta aegis]
MEDAQTQLFVNVHEEITTGTFCDIQIVCNDGKTTGSRIVLAAMSPYFRAMFTSDMLESQTGIVNLPTMSLSVFQDIIKMSLCGISLVNEKNCVKVLDSAEMMQLHHIKQLCNIYLKEHLVLTTRNCLHWWRLSKLYNFLNVSNRAFCYLISNIPDFVKTGKIVQLLKPELLEIISSKDLKCKEDTVLRCAMKWIEHNNPDPNDVKEIFENVQLHFVDPKFLIDDVVFSDIVCKNKSVQAMVQEVLHVRLYSRVTDRSRVSPDMSVFVLHRNNKSLLSRFTPDGKWEDAPPAPLDPGSWYSAASLDEKIYITGGNIRKKCTLIYNTNRKLWTIGPNLIDDRGWHCAATVDSKVYAIGGRYSNTIEMLAHNSRHWQVTGDLGLKRLYTCSVTVDENILIMGGRNDWGSSDVIQCFNTRSHAVSKLNTKLPCTSESLRGFKLLHLPDVYLLDNDGHVMHLRVTSTEGEIEIQIKSKEEWKSFNYYFGVTQRNGRLLCFTADGISAFNLSQRKEELRTFPSPPRCAHVYDVCVMGNT